MGRVEMPAGRTQPPQAILHVVPPRDTRPQIRLFIADNHNLFRQVLRKVLEIDGSFLIVGEASDGRQALQAIEKAKPEIALVDLGLPLLNGLELAHRLDRSGTRTRVVILAARAQESLLLRMLDSGVAGYLLKDADLQELLHALRKVHSGYSYLTPTLEGGSIRERLRPLRRSAEGVSADLLTSRERELLQLVLEGYSNREIADQLCLSVKTVEAHKNNICSKLNVRGRVGLLMHAVHAGMIGIGG